MIGIWQSYSNFFLYTAGTSILVFYGLPLLLVPLNWARVFRWEVPQVVNLTVFLGRSLGVLLSVLAIFAFMAAGSPEAKPFYFDLLLWMLAAVGALHVYGAIRKTQPVTETLEILLWAALLLLTLCFYPL